MNVFIDAFSLGREFVENPDAFIEAMGALMDNSGGMFIDDLGDAQSGRTEEIAVFLRRAADAMSGQQ
jgi:hypothetical protein